MPSIGAALCLYNGESHDFCWRQTIESLSFCQEIAIAEGGSTDGTREALEQMAKADSRIKIVDYPFTKPNGDPLWVMNFYNHAREALSTQYCITLDCDEVIEEGAGDKIQEKIGGRNVSLVLRRWNFWKDAQHLVPYGVCLANEVLRVAPRWCWIPADVPVPQGQAAMDMMIPALGIQVFHYGFLRKREAFFKKEKFLQTAFTGGYDPKLEEADKAGGKWMEHPDLAEWQNRLETFTGKHPKIIHQWLKDRNYDI